MIYTLVERAGKVYGEDREKGCQPSRIISQTSSMTHTCVKDAVLHLSSYRCTFPVDTQACTVFLLVVVAE